MDQLYSLIRTIVVSIGVLNIMCIRTSCIIHDYLTSNNFFFLYIYIFQIAFNVIQIIYFTIRKK